LLGGTFVPPGRGPELIAEKIRVASSPKKPSDAAGGTDS
jgi:hypothetical protein